MELCRCGKGRINCSVLTLGDVLVQSGDGIFHGEEDKLGLEFEGDIARSQIGQGRKEKTDQSVSIAVTERMVPFEGLSELSRLHMRPDLSKESAREMHPRRPDGAGRRAPPLAADDDHMLDQRGQVGAPQKGTKESTNGRL